ncbi:MAG: TIM barrel protein [Opitutaceae bacterium]|nr:TIM barrel protein [Opitutaceae bacterium]
MSNKINYRFSFGPWNISEGADPFGPVTRKAYDHESKFALYRPLGFEGIQFHDDDVVPNLAELNVTQALAKASEVKKALDNQGLVAEFVAPRLWFAGQTIDGGYTSNSAIDRKYALDRTLQAVDIARSVGTKAIVFWLAREGTYIREAKDVKLAYQRLLEVVNRVLDYDKEIEIWIEPKPNEPTDLAFVPTTGHAISLAYASDDHKRVKTVIESAHAILANLDPGDEMAFALSHDKLGSVHLNDQNGLKYDQDKSFGSVNLRAAFNQVLVLEDNGYGRRGEFVGLDVKAMRTQAGFPVVKHLSNTRQIFLDLVEKARTYDRKRVAACRETRDYEGLELYTVQHLLGTKSAV